MLVCLFNMTQVKTGLCRLGSLTFKAPDNVKYPSMDLAYAAGRAGGTMTGVLSAANEKAVEMFIDEKYVFCFLIFTQSKCFLSNIGAYLLDKCVFYFCFPWDSFSR